MERDSISGKEVSQNWFNEEFLLRTISSVEEAHLLSWMTSTADVIKEGARLKKVETQVGSDSLARCRERARREGKTGMTFWETPGYQVTQSTA